MQRAFRPSDDTGRGGDVVRRERRILGFARHGYEIEKPVHFESIGIESMMRDLPRDVDEQRVIDIERLAGKWEQAGEHRHGKKYVMKVLVVNAVDKR